ncbi:hypothetical protein PANT_25d00044 [Moesziomyces antarcticus T-34]|uniref:Uncharacterized protein n=1 Tax=Pseudozyma antarctica (strain T-34) TaxID=1151754 RepID=M9M7S6_PSEA3|nr:hypothetical protein PANT_25d00044 [Moesziomyces antarcticus T-34]
MNTSNHQQYYGGNAYANRTDSYAPLRPEGLGLGSIFPGQDSAHDSRLRQQQPQQYPSHHQHHQQNNAYRSADPLRDISALQASLEDQLAAMRLQSSHNSDAQLGYQSYAANQGGYAHQHQYAQQQQYLQMQLQQQFAQQQAAVQQQKIELLRLQALQKQQQQQQQLQYGHQQLYSNGDNSNNNNNSHQQQLAAQQRLLLSQLQGGHGELDMGSLYNTPAASAQEQRQAAQASLQASLRQRQVQQLYQTMGLENGAHATAPSYNDSIQQQQQQQQLQNILNRHTRQVSNEGAALSRVPLDQRSWRGGAMAGEERMPTPPSHRGSSPASSVSDSRRPMRPSSGTAESIMSMRSRTMTPSIVIDDSASEGSRAHSEFDQVEGDQTPETSEEDLEVHTTPMNKAVLATTPRPHQMQTQMQLHKQANGGRYGSLGRAGANAGVNAGAGAGAGAGASASAPTSTSATPPMSAPKAIPRAIHLSAAPQHRAFKANGSSDGVQTINNAGLTLPPIQPRRQPKGQPSDFAKVNFQARMNSRLRKDAMSKLCASPRAASFGGNGMSFGARLSSAGSNVGGVGVMAAQP